MKKCLAASLLLLLFISGYSQTIQFEHTGSRAAIINKEKLNNAQLLKDILPGFPNVGCKNVDCIGVEVSGICNGKPVSASGKNDTLSAEQKNILGSADMNTDIFIKIKYQYNTATNNAGVNNRKTDEVEYALTPGPRTDAEYPGGTDQITNYIKENVVDKIFETGASLIIPSVSVAFTVNEQGKITEAKIYRTSAHAELDKLLLEAIKKMPDWKPAEYSKGVNVKQKFIINLPFKGDGC
jgi:TonB family protein